MAATTNTKICWGVFFNDYHTIEALKLFIEGQISLQELDLRCSESSESCAKEMTKVKWHHKYGLGIQHVENLAVKALRRRGYKVQHKPRRATRFVIAS